MFVMKYDVLKMLHFTAAFELVFFVYNVATSLA